jgi:AP-1 complex subunit beta-1
MNKAKDAKGAGDGRFFSTTKKGETQELRAELQSATHGKKVDAVKKVIANMTVGKDVSMLFTDIVNCASLSCRGVAGISARLS